MRAIVVRAFGGPEELRIEDVADPVPGEGELLVDVEAIGIQYVETQVRTGQLQGISPVAPAGLPWTPGREVAGTVRAVGPGTDPELVGRRVAGQTASQGAYAELAVIPTATAHVLPEQLSCTDAVALLGTGRTAVGLVETAGIGKGDTVLIESAAGAVGAQVIQLARAAGAERVIGLARGEEKLALVRELGADAAVDYTAEDWPAQVRAAAPEGVTVVLDGVGGEIGRQAFELTAPGGRFVVFGFASGARTVLDPAVVAERGIVTPAYLGPPTGPRSPQEQLRQIREALAAAADGRLKPLLGRSFPLADAAAAHTAISNRETVGKTVLVP